MAAPTAKDRVLKTTEILESILLQLPIRDLLVSAQQVSQGWNIIIQSSPAIQEALFFQPPRTSDQEQIFNPLLQTSFAPWFNNHDEINTQWISGITFHDLDWNRTVAKRHAYARKEASWRKMLLVKPAIKQLDVVKLTHAMCGDTECCGEVYFKYGVRMGPLYDLVQEEVKRPTTGVGVKWVREETSGLLSGLAKPLGLGKERNRIVMTVNHTVQRCIGRPDRLGPEFKSLDYKKVEIKWGPTKYMPFR